MKEFDQPIEIDGIYYKLISENITTQKEIIAEVISCMDRQVPGSLGNVIIPNLINYENKQYQVKSIGDGAFKGCSALTSITIPDCVTSIGNRAFEFCSGLSSIIVGNGNSQYDSREDCNAIIETSTNKLLVGCKNTIIPVSVLTIAEGAFRGCRGLTSITIPDSVTSIGDEAFYYCSGLTSITIPDSVTNIGSYALSGCSGLTSITIPDRVTSIEVGAFYGCSGLTSITIPDSVTSIGNIAFSGCSGLTSITIPDSVTSIGDEAFYYCSGLTSITIPDSVTNIGYAFCGCTELTDVFCYLEKPLRIDSDIFDYSNIEYAILHVPAKSIPYYKAAEPWKRFYKIVAIEDGERHKRLSRKRTPKV